ncbi:hypothetical protein QMK19_28935 [Streptomyces sp. H10-C2]|uniref:SCO6880 family protein n=1 Tax=unclassified Streptomyces TaxID=2593676 RepID=UPI0024BAAB37|nr:MULTISPECIES: SCO6880 family protein [unclassified Streptomyces]MDJ0344236.1 hypothetical protein [Streptomyces sp. PH10-H1]MDJ0373574.1 hypothetical protein [Streptomyces sp. H10-C2]
MPTSSTPSQLTYGNWRKPQTAGLGKLGLGGTLLLLGGMIVVVLTALASVVAALVLAVLLLMALAPLLVRDRHGRTALQRMAVRIGWRRSVSNGSHLYRSGPLGRTRYGTCQLPGLAAASTVMEASDAYNRPFALLTYPNTNHHVVVLTTDADGAGLVDQDQVDTWVAHWGQWLAGLAHEPGLVGASVSIEAAPDTGVRLRHEVESNLVEGAPALAAAMFAEVLESYPAGSAQISTRITLTYSGAARPGVPRRTANDMAVELGNRLPGLTSTLASTGAGPARPMTAVQLAEAVRVAYDPSVATLVEQARSTGGSGLTWSDSGPIGAEETWEHYRHDSAHSVTWSMSEAPRGEVFSSVLTTLLRPHSDIARKRVTLLYRPHDPAAAAKIVERDRLDALFRAQAEPVSKARENAALRAAEQSAREEATGAGVLRFALLYTATATDAADLPLVAAATDTLSAPARIRLRPVVGSQASAFAAALPIGLVLPSHLSVPASVRDNF